MTDWNPKLMLGNDGKLYVEKVVGPADKPFFTAVVPAGDSDLPKNRISGETLKLQNYTKLSMSDVILVHSFFKEVYRVHKSEAIVLFHKDNPDDAHYKVLVPEVTTASAGHLSYDAAQIAYCETCRICNPTNVEKCPQCGGTDIRPTQIYGTAHSHGAMSAFHSGTDDAHEKGQTGFHITFGKVDEPLVHIAPSFVVACVGHFKNGEGTRYKVAAEELIDIPFSEREMELVGRWTSRIFSQNTLQSLKGDDEIVFCAERNLPVRWTTDQAMKAVWDSCQPHNRRLEKMTISEYQKRLEAKKTPPSSSNTGSGQSAPHGSPVIRGGVTPSTTVVSDSAVNLTTFKIGDTSAKYGRHNSSTVLEDEFEGDFLHYKVIVDCDMEPTVAIVGSSGKYRFKNFGFEDDFNVSAPNLAEAVANFYLSRFETLLADMLVKITDSSPLHATKSSLWKLKACIKDLYRGDGKEDDVLSGYAFNLGEPGEITVLDSCKKHFADVANPALGGLNKQPITGCLYVMGALFDLMDEMCPKGSMLLNQLLPLETTAKEFIKAVLQEAEFEEIYNMSQSYFFDTPKD